MAAEFHPLFRHLDERATFCRLPAGRAGSRRFVREDGGDLADPLLDAGAQAENLKAARVGHDGAVPAHEPVQPAHFGNHVGPWAEVKVIGVGEDDLSAHFFQVIRRERLHRGLRAHSHEGGRLHLAVGRGEPPHTGHTALVKNLKGEAGRLHSADSFAHPALKLCCGALSVA